jgi:hypothetical protein
MPDPRLPNTHIMTDQRKALHDQVEQTREEDIDRLVGFINRFLHPLESPESEGIVFDLMPPGFEAAAEIEQQRQDELAQLKARQAEMITRFIGDTVTRLRIDLNNIGQASCGWSASRGKTTDFTCRWFEGRVCNCLSMFLLKEQQIVTFERCHISETKPELIYHVRLLTPIADLEKELTVAI